jgi:ribosome assembly protein YihI (activator of Der GTPase)
MSVWMSECPCVDECTIHERNTTARARASVRMESELRDEYRQIQKKRVGCASGERMGRFDVHAKPAAAAAAAAALA